MYFLAPVQLSLTPRESIPRLIATLSDAWPHNIHSPIPYEAKDIQDKNDCVLTLTNGENAENNAPLAHFRSRDQKSDAQS